MVVVAVSIIVAELLVVIVVKDLVWAGVIINMSVEMLVIGVWTGVVAGTRADVVVINAVYTEVIA